MTDVSAEPEQPRDDGPSPHQATGAGTAAAETTDGDHVDDDANDSPTSPAEAGHPDGGGDAATPEGEAAPSGEEPVAASDEGAAPASAPAEAAPEEPAETAPEDAAEAAPEGAAETAPEDAAETAPEEPADAASEQPSEGAEEPAGEQTAKKKGKKKGKKAKAAEQAPSLAEARRRVGTTTEAALRYVDHPEPRWQRLPRAVREDLVAELPAVTAAALLGPAALARHLVASAAAGRYRDLFGLWTLFSRHPEETKPELADRGPALEKGRRHLRLATELGLMGSADRVAEDVTAAEGLIWQWLREVLTAHPKAVAARPAVITALLGREPDASALDALPARPSPRWLAEAAEVKERGALPEPLEQLLAANVHRLPATISTLRLAARHYPDRVAGLVDAVDLDAPDVEAFLAWARDHGSADRLVGRIRDRINAAAARDRAEGLAHWDAWRRRGVELPLPASIKEGGIDGLDLSRPETAELAGRLEAAGYPVGMQQRLEDLAGQNRQLAEKAYEAAVCAGLDVTLPAALEHNPIVKEGTRCPRCRAWTWVRPGHEKRCPRPEPTPQPSPSEAFELAAAESTERS